LTIDDLRSPGFFASQLGVECRVSEPLSFEPFSFEHLVTLGIIAALCGLVAWSAKKFSRAQTDRLGRVLGVSLAGYVVTAYVQKGLAGELRWENSLPLELCHCVLLACIVALFRPNPLAFETAYFWGLGGTLQGVVTPDLGLGFPSWDFIQFFWAHGTILLAIVYLIAARNLRPRAASVPRMFLAVNLYALAVGSIDLVFGWNYGYLRHPPSQPSLIDYLGPWPWYILSLELVALLSFMILELPWRLLAKRNNRTLASSR
jgi:hypothetical integral membrane protein (TIGR02206 family)